jgi:hypothetical protein
MLIGLPRNVSLMLIVWFLAILKMSLRSCSDPSSIVKMAPLLRSIDVVDEGSSLCSLLSYRIEISTLVLGTTGWDIDLEVVEGILYKKDKKSLPWLFFHLSPRNTPVISLDLSMPEGEIMGLETRGGIFFEEDNGSLPWLPFRFPSHNMFPISLNPPTISFLS